MKNKRIEVTDDLLRSIYGQFDIMATIVPRYPDWVYINFLTGNPTFPFIVKQATEILEEYKRNRKELKRCYRCEAYKPKYGEHQCGVTPVVISLLL